MAGKGGVGATCNGFRLGFDGFDRGGAQTLTADKRLGAIWKLVREYIDTRRAERTNSNTYTVQTSDNAASV